MTDRNRPSRWPPPTTLPRDGISGEPLVAADRVGTSRTPTVRAGGRRRLRHPAKGARITAAGIGFTAMSALVAVMGLGAPSNAPAAAAVPVDTLPTTGPAPTLPTASAPVPDAKLIPLPVRPHVTPAPVTAAPTARSNGSR